MISPVGLVAPEPVRNWLDQHEPGDELRFTVTERRDTEVKNGARAGESLTWITVVDESGREWELPLGRADLKPLAEKDDVQVGDAAVLKYWGLSGTKEIYTRAVRHAAEQEELNLASPIEETPPLTDADHAPVEYDEGQSHVEKDPQ